MEKATLEQNYETLYNKPLGKIFVIMGQAGAGKSSITKDIAKLLDMERIITYTTRPPREGEINGADYHFINENEFKNNDLVCKEEYIVKPNGFCGYGVLRSDIEQVKNVLIVLTPSGYHELKEIYGDRVLGIYIMARRQERYDRYISRDPHDEFVIAEANRRFESDDKDFFELEFDTDYSVLNNEDYETALFRTNSLIQWELSL